MSSLARGYPLERTGVGSLSRAREGMAGFYMCLMCRVERKGGANGGVSYICGYICVYTVSVLCLGSLWERDRDW